MNLEKLKDMIYFLVKEGINTRIRIVKILYFVDLQAKKELGKTLTNVEWIYSYTGAYSHQIFDALFDMLEEEIRENYDVLAGKYHYHVLENRELNLTDEEVDVIRKVIKKYGKLNEKEILEKAYKTLKGVNPGERISI